MDLNFSGISALNAERIRKLNRGAKGPFTVTQAAKILNMKKNSTAFLLSYLTNRGWLNRIKTGVYIVVPLDTSSSDWIEDPWIVASYLFSPGYIGGWSACEYWGLTEQIFRDIVFVTCKSIRNTNPVVQATKFRVKSVSKQRFFGLKIVWRKSSKIKISDPSRTIVDILDDPSLGGGIRNVAEIFFNYSKEKERDYKILIDYSERFGNRTIFKRLGYLVESLKIDSPFLIQECRKRMSKGYSLLDPKMKNKGKLLRRWNLKINSNIQKEEFYK